MAPPSSAGCVPGALIPLVGLLPTVLMLAPFALELWFKDESSTQCHSLLDLDEERELKSRPRRLRASLNCLLVNSTTILPPCCRVSLAPKWAGTGLRGGWAPAHPAQYLPPPGSSVVFSLQGLTHKLEWAPMRARCLGAPLWVFCLPQRCFMGLPIIAGLESLYLSWQQWSPSG